MAGISQQASVIDDILYAPYLPAANTFYSAEFLIIPDSDPIQLELLATIEVVQHDALTASSFEQGILYIPEILIDGLSYWAEFQQLSDTEFELMNWGSNAGATQDGQLIIQPVWNRLEGGAFDVGIGADGAVWVIGTDERSGGFGIYYWAGSRWQRVKGAAVRIDVEPDGTPWVVNDKHQIHQWVNGDWQQMHGDARDIGIGADGSIWVAAGGGIFRWNGVSWDRTSGSAVRIDVDPYGTPWVIDNSNDIYELIDGMWIRRPSSARDIGIGADGSVWIIGTSGGSGGHGIYRWSGYDWIQVHGSARQVSVDPYGIPWVAGSGGKIYQGM